MYLAHLFKAANGVWSIGLESLDDVNFVQRVAETLTMEVGNCQSVKQRLSVVFVEWRETVHLASDIRKLE